MIKDEESMIGGKIIKSNNCHSVILYLVHKTN